MFKGTRADREPGLLREGNYDRIFLMEAAKSTMTNRNPYRFSSLTRAMKELPKKSKTRWLLLRLWGVLTIINGKNG